MSSRSSLSTSRLEARRKIERDAQRAARARTKSRIVELEGKIESLLSAQEDHRLSVLLQQLDEQQAENRKLQAGLANIQKILDATTGTKQVGRDQEEVIPADEPKKLIPCTSLPQNQLAAPENQRIQLGEALNRRQREEPTWKIVNEALDSAITLMTHTTRTPIQSDADISIRAILEGWGDVERIYCLDAGWQLLRQVDQHLFFPCGPVTRLAILRSMRLRLLVRWRC
jgi:hypothetical protein